jgi:hypothetical protein
MGAGLLDRDRDAASVEAVIDRLVTRHALSGSADPTSSGGATGPIADLLRAALPSAPPRAVGLETAAPASRAAALLGFALCAARHGDWDDAVILALESRRAAPGQPRASCLAGLCELERGNRRAAQTHLATAARLARANPAHGEDLRLAQRALLLMHLT